MGFGTRELVECAAKIPTFVAAISTAKQGCMIPSPGGVLITDANGQVIVAVGISGDTGPNDETCAVVGIEAVGCGSIPSSAQPIVSIMSWTPTAYNSMLGGRRLA